MNIMKNLRELASRRYRAVLPRREAVACWDSVSPAASTRSVLLGRVRASSHIVMGRERQSLFGARAEEFVCVNCWGYRYSL